MTTLVFGGGGKRIWYQVKVAAHAAQSAQLRPSHASGSDRHLLTSGSAAGFELWFRAVTLVRPSGLYCPLMASRHTYARLSTTGCAETRTSCW